ncbi:PD-(D/E)XK nuclease family protein [Streptomyces sp. QH1-20]|uniref:PD-(D/E)XK nuclease family protein n=1 Tax=Streptomyces sp. QH1-20 TaxID=3240934 RepID=UPI003517666A
MIKAAGRLPAKPVEDFSFKPLFALLDAVECEGRSLKEAAADPTNFRKCTPVHIAWAREAAAVYLAARTAMEARRGAEGASLRRVIPAWVVVDALEQPDARGATQYEQTVWGRQYASEDGAVREIWIPSLGTVNSERPDVEIAAVADVLLNGVPSRTPFDAPADPLPWPRTRPQRVRIVGVGLLDGTTEVVDWTAEEAGRRIQEAGLEAALVAVVEGREARPGRDCVRCAALPVCRAVPQAPGLLGVDAAPRKRRSLSVTDLRVYGECPERYHATRVLKLRDGRAENTAIRRGRAVDAWLNARHADPDRIPCRVIELPGGLPGLEDVEQPEALAMIRRHRAHCPFDGMPDREAVEPQRRLVAYDARADVLVVADCDLVYSDRGGVVVRETKTTTGSYIPPGGLMSRYPQLALAVLLVHHGVLGGDGCRSRVELEVLRPDSSRLEELDPHDPRTVARARAELQTSIAGWVADRSYPAQPRPETGCASCEVHRWCATGRSNGLHRGDAA